VTSTADLVDLGTRDFWTNLRAPVRRSRRRFAEEELILASGPFEGLHFRADVNPWTGQVLDIMDSGLYRRFFASGPVQAGKTLLFFVCAIMYHLFECRENVIVGVPKVDMAQSIFDERIRPSIMASRYRHLLPTTGPGSRGGRFTEIRFNHGPVLRFLGGGGGDAQIASYTARVVAITEVDKMDAPGSKSKETDPIRKLESRANAFGEAALIYGECTLTTKYGRTHQEIVDVGTDSKVWVECPLCAEYVVPKREDFGGWRSAETVIDARAAAKYTCPKCGGDWSEDLRREANRNQVVAAGTQSVERGAAVVGDPPATNTFGFRWNCMTNALVTMADIGEREWKADRDPTPDSEKELLQYWWAEPYEDQLADLSGLSRDIILSKIGAHPRGFVPDHAKYLTVGIDVGGHLCHWLAVAWTPDAQGYVVDYGAIHVQQEREISPAAVLSSLRQFREDVLRPGWGKPPHLVVVDSGWAAAKIEVYRLCAESKAVRMLPTKGLGTARGQSGWRQPKPGPGRQLGREWVLARQPEGVDLFEPHADFWKGKVHEGIRAPAGVPGSIALFKDEPVRHLGLVRHLTSEREEEEFAPGKGTRRVWNRVHRQNHWFDCMYMARAAADALGVRLEKAAPRAARKPGIVRIQKGSKGIRTKY